MSVTSPAPSPWPVTSPRKNHEPSGDGVDVEVVAADHSAARMCADDLESRDIDRRAAAASSECAAPPRLRRRRALVAAVTRLEHDGERGDRQREDDERRDRKAERRKLGTIAEKGPVDVVEREKTQLMTSARVTTTSTPAPGDAYGDRERRQRHGERDRERRRRHGECGGESQTRSCSRDCAADDVRERPPTRKGVDRLRATSDASARLTKNTETNAYVITSAFCVSAPCSTYETSVDARRGAAPGAGDRGCRARARRIAQC